MKSSQIAVIDFGSQYTHLITRRIRQLGVLANIFPPNVKASDLKNVQGIILSGGPSSVHDKTAIAYDKKLFSLGVPILGLCYGHQLITQHFGGQVKPGKTKEYGFANLKLIGTSEILSGVGNKTQVWMSHGDTAVKVPAGFEVVGSTIDCPVAAMANSDKKIYGLQFHPEVAHSHSGEQILSNFVFKICGAKPDWSIDKYFNQIVADVKKQVGKRKVFLLVSGGVDSTVCFALLEKILGKEKVFGLHIDNGFMRLNESRQVKAALAKAGFDNLVVVDAADQFLGELKGVVDPETKRHIIGRVFLQTKDEFMHLEKMNQADWVLGQGTIYPDTIETGGTKHADTIKTHHNRVAEILKLMKLGALVEPLAGLYKDEVREIAKKLKLPSVLVDRHPFPGPGLAIRVLGSSGREKINHQAQANRQLSRIVGKKLKATILPLKSVGVQGDNRTYRHPALIAGQAPWSKLHHLSVRLTNEVSAVNRAVYLVSPRQVNFSKIQLKKADLNQARLDLLRQIDALVLKEIKRHKLYKNIWQMPVVLAPLTLKGGETIILRPVESREAMTVNFYQMPQRILKSLAAKILKIPGVDMVLYDITNKPPGTIEWE